MRDSLHTLIRDLHRRRARERRGLALAEGVRLLEEALATGVALEAVLVSPALEGTSRGRALKAALAASGARLAERSDRELAGLAATSSPRASSPSSGWRPPASTTSPSVRGRCWWCSMRSRIPATSGPSSAPRTRSARSGWSSLPGTAELTNPKTLRATMGAAFRLPVVASDDEGLADWLRVHHVTLIATGLGGEPFAPERLPRPLALVLGNEGAGVRPTWASVRTVSIPLVSGVESLNVAVAAGILLYGVTRE